MSSLGKTAEAVVDSLQTVMIVNYCDLAITALLLYDMAVTFFDEYHHMWKGRKTGVTILFLANRYLMILQYILAPLTDCVRWHDNTLCTTGADQSSFLSSLWHRCLQVYAISRQHWKYAIAVAVLQMSNWSINCYLLGSAGFATLPAPFFGCTPVNNLSPELYNKFVVPGRSFMIVSDAIVLYVTWSNTYGIRKAAAKAQLRTPLLTLLLRDGTLYFLLTLILNVTILGLWFNASLQFFPNLVQPIQSVLITHFLLNLRDVSSMTDPLDQSTNDPYARTQTHLSTVSFATNLVGNMGAPLQHGFATSESDSMAYTDEDLWEEECLRGVHELQELSTVPADVVLWHDEATSTVRNRGHPDHDVG